MCVIYLLRSHVLVPGHFSEFAVVRAEAVCNDKGACPNDVKEGAAASKGSIRAIGETRSLVVPMFYLCYFFVISHVRTMCDSVQLRLTRLWRTSSLLTSTRRSMTQLAAPS